MTTAELPIVQQAIPYHLPGQSSHYYKVYGCPHPECRAVATAEAGATRARRRAERTLDPRTGRLIHPRLAPVGTTDRAAHGTKNGYNGYGCSCQPCEVAGSRRGRHRRVEIVNPAVHVDDARRARAAQRSRARAARGESTATELRAVQVPAPRAEREPSVSALQWLDNCSLLTCCRFGNCAVCGIDNSPRRI